ncbi:tape measure protein [Pseudarthrobacter sp. PS3-L1]|uniref:tape measure protein n=1 Tax=Pseudarthrobacter sp. PS3-L1 TaxID=3046207 RepID=UPI0024B9599E|nr:tape measure protein [Pseudarthrobacter sp. PS3-L1]MDJ0321656.1 tape measure protein [Pseudarthrobacter sp. PS3-L1]
MADQVGAGEVAIAPTFVGFRGKVNSEVETSGSESGRKFSTAFGSAVKGIGSFVGKGLLAGGAVTAAIGAFSIKGGISKALQIEDATAKMTGLGNSTSTVSEVMANALSAVKGTAFGMGDAANVASTALASGIKPGEEMSKYLTLVADAASTAQVPLGEMGSIMGKVTNSGKVTNDVLNQFGDRGVGVLQMLAKEYGVTSEELTKMVSEGKVDAATFNKVLTENLGGAAKRSGDTTRGAFANMKSAMANFGVALIGGFLPLVKPVFNQIQKLFEGLTKRLKPFADAWAAAFSAKAGPVIEGFADKALTAFDKILGSISAFVSAFRAGGDEVTSSGLNGFIERLGLVTGNVFREMRGGFLAFSASWVAFDGEVTSVGFPGFMERLAFTTKTALVEMRGAVTAFGAAWTANDGEVTSSGLPGFMERVAYVVHQVVDAVGQLDFSSWTAFTGSLGTAGGTIGSALGPALASMGQSLRTLLPAAQEFAKQMPNIGGAVAKVAAVGLTVLTTTLAFLADNVDTIIAFMPLIVAGFIAWRIATAATAGAMFSLQAAQVAMAPVNLANNILRVTAIRLEMQHAAATGANTAAQNVGMFATIRATAAMVAQRVATAAGVVAMGIATAAQWAWNAALSANPIALVVLAIAALVAGLIWFFTQTELGRAIFQSVFQFIQDTVNNVLVWFAGTLVPTLMAVWASIQAGLAVLGSFFSDTWSNVTTGVGDFITGLVQFFIDLPGKILSVLGNLGTLLLDSGRSLIQGFIDGISGMVGAIGDAVGGVLDFARDFFPFSPAKRGPFSGSGYTSNSGKAMAGDFAKGITSQQAQVGAAASSLMSAATLTGDVSVGGAAAGVAGGGSAALGNTYNLTVPVQRDMDPYELAHAMDNRLNRALRMAR